MKTTAKYIGLFLLGFCIGYTGFSLALAQEETPLTEEEVVLFEPITVSSLPKDDVVLGIMASSTASLETAVTVKYANENNQKLIDKLDVMIVLLSEINDKLTR